jgi:hypothetical protein
MTRAHVGNIVTLKSKLLALIALGTTPALASGVVLTTDLSKLRIEMVDLPDHVHAIVAWQNLPGPRPSGAMVYQQDQSDSETRYFAVGGGGLFAIIDHGGRHRSFSVIADDPAHPERMIVESRDVELATLQAKYDAFENIAPAKETKPVIEANVTAAAAQTDKACGGHLAPQIRWAGFTGKLGLAKQAVSILEALETACADKDYRAVARTLTALTVDFKADSALQLAHTGTTLSVVIGDTSFNPRESAEILIKKQL